MRKEATYTQRENPDRTKMATNLTSNKLNLIIS